MLRKNIRNFWTEKKLREISWSLSFQEIKFSFVSFISKKHFDALFFPCRQPINRTRKLSKLRSEFIRNATRLGEKMNCRRFFASRFFPRVWNGILEKSPRTMNCVRSIAESFYRSCSILSRIRFVNHFSEKFVFQSYNFWIVEKRLNFSIYICLLVFCSKIYLLFPI